MVNTYQKFVSYVGAGNLATYTFPFKVKSSSEILVMVFDTLTNLPVFVESGNIGINVQSVTFDAVNGGGTIVLPANLAVNRKIFIKLGIENPAQDFQFREQSDFKLRQIEQGLDYCVMMIQRLFEKSSRAMSFDDKSSFITGLNTQISALPIPNGIPIMNSTGTALGMIDAATLVGASGGGVPNGGLDEQVLGNTAGVPTWKDYAYNGFSARFGSTFISTSLKDTLDKIINIVYVAPTISLSGTINFLREIGTVVTNITLNATATRTSNPITIIQILDGGTVLLNLNPTVSPNSQVASVGFPGPFSTNKSFQAVVSDGVGTGNGSVNYQFVYPYYLAPGPAGLTPAQVGTLQKSITASTATFDFTFNVVGAQKYYFAQLASYPPLTSILDVSNFNTLPDWTVTVANITGLDGTAQSYRIYEFNNIVSTGAYFYSFRR